MRAFRLKLSLYLTLIPALGLAESLEIAGIAPLSWFGLVVLAPCVSLLALLGGWLVTERRDQGRPVPDSTRQEQP